MNNLPLSPNALLMAGIVALVCWRVYARYRRLIGRQRVGQRRLTVSMVLFPVLLILVGLSASRSAVMLETMAGGVVVGVALGIVGLKLTRFETTADGYFYTPNTVLGITVMLLFVGRLAYRFGTIYLSSGRFEPATMQSMGSSPLTLGIFGVVAAYYTTSAAGILLWYRKARGGAAAPAAIAGTSIG